MNSFNRSTLRSRGLWVLAAIACTATAGTAYGAFGSVETRSVKVSFADLNIGTPQGAAVLYSRIKRAARTVCGIDTATVEELKYHAFQPCYQAAIAEAVTKVNSPMLTALHGKSDPSGARILLSQAQRPSAK